MTRDQLAEGYARRANYWLCRMLYYERRAQLSPNRHVVSANLALARDCRRTALAVYARLFATGSDCR